MEKKITRYEVLLAALGDAHNGLEYFSQPGNPKAKEDTKLFQDLILALHNVLMLHSRYREQVGVAMPEDKKH